MPESAARSSETHHASCVAIQGRGLLILGSSGTGKSALALQLMAYGAELVADDRTILKRQNGELIAYCPAAIAGVIEARGIGLLRATATGPVPLAGAVDLGRIETARLPEPRVFEALGCAIPLLYRVEAAHFAPALFQFLKTGLRKDL